MIPEPTVSGRTGFVPHCGGAIFNTAIALGRLGAPAGLLTGLSHDMFGTQLTAALHASDVETTHVIHADRPTTLAFVELVEGQARYTFMDENSAGRMLTPDDMPTLAAEITALYFGGISLACEPGAEAYAALLKSQGQGRVTMLDPNIRESFISDPARYRARLSDMIARTDIVKISDEDLNWIIPQDVGLEVKARQLLDQGPRIVILTEGAKGSAGFMRDGTSVSVPARKATVVDTVGAGDTFNAGVLASLSRAGLLHTEGLAQITADDLSAALTLGAQVAAVTVSRAGANPPWANELTA